MKRTNIKKIMLAMMCGGALAITTASCDPIWGFSFYRDDGHGGFYDTWDDGYYYDDCYFDDCFFGDLWFF